MKDSHFVKRDLYLSKFVILGSFYYFIGAYILVFKNICSSLFSSFENHLLFYVGILSWDLYDGW